jgi:hypothetical protein
MAEFSDNHKRVLVNTFRHVDGMLMDMEKKLGGLEPRSPFREYTTDLSHEQSKIIMCYIGIIQDAMLKFLGDQGIPCKRNNTSIRRAVETAIQFMHIAFEELRPKYLRGYGALPAEPARELNEFVSKIQGLLDQLNGELGTK